jgi:hypothetical protein|tara:strand:- start:285 stop:1409 length:1125 start_codon:yes stop_codon:yes gene_type:complete
MIIPEADAEWAADEFIDYFGHFTSIEDYLRYVKREIVTETNPLTSLKDEFFNEDIHPEEMEFDIKFIGSRFNQSLPQDHYNNLLKAVSSHNNESNIPGRELRWMVYEKRSQQVLGFIRFGSPTINSKPRNIWLGNQPNLSIFNRHAVMGFVIVPSQPFGYNYLGGKLLALLCVSHFARETLNEVFEKDIGLFETTSLYGSTTSASQYDGLKPYMRYKGLTESKFLPLLHADAFHKLHDHFTKLNGNQPLTDNKASSKKMKRQTKMISWIKNSLKEYGHDDKLSKFNAVIDMAFGLTQKKRFYISDYGYANIREVLLGEEDKLRKGQNWDKFHLENIISWWKRKATKRYDKLKQDGRFRDKVELWTEDNNIQIIR